VLASGGTGGHLFPAQALAAELEARNWEVHLLTDERGMAWQDRFTPGTVHEISSSTLTLSKPWKLFKQAMQLLDGYRESLRLFIQLRPKVVVGFGGYPSLPVMFAAQKNEIASMVHEQNSVAGRANRIAVRFAGAQFIATSFDPVYGFSKSQLKRIRLTGNPVREAVLDAVRPYEPADAGDTFNLLVFGGSQGARFFSEFMPKVIAELPRAVLKSLRVIQQCRPEDIQEVRRAYRDMKVKAVCESFFADMPDLIASSHLVICRAGASTVAELGAIGRPAVYVPLPHSLDNDQLHNAESMERAGGGWLKRQSEMSASEIADFITRVRFDPVTLAKTAESAALHGRPNAAALLADLVEELAKPEMSEETEIL
jgi:UDP-N-acetylglucosamine--N-acetylmuramyl-(pentapeptide) pyrophosphoryl-undecaprenol N-acetylglucosamine transferase